MLLSSLRAAWAVRRVRLRCLARGDVGTVAAVMAGLSPDSRARRFHGPRPTVPPALLATIADVDGHARQAVVAEVREAGRWLPVGLGEVAAVGPTSAELAVCVADAWQGRGIGNRLLAELRLRAETAGFEELAADVLTDNAAAIRAVSKVLPAAQQAVDHGVVRISASIGPKAHQLSVDDVLSDLPGGPTTDRDARLAVR